MMVLCYSNSMQKTLHACYTELLIPVVNCVQITLVICIHTGQEELPTMDVTCKYTKISVYWFKSYSFTDAICGVSHILYIEYSSFDVCSDNKVAYQSSDSLST